MTLKELSQLYYLNREIERDKERLKELRSSCTKITARYSDMPKGKSDTHDPMAQKVVDIVDLEKKLNRNIEKRYQEENKIMNFIDSIDDCFLRLIFKLRFIDGKPWNVVAWQVGGGNTSDTVRNGCYRYLTRLKKLSQMSQADGI